MTPPPSLPAPVLPRPQQKRLSERLVLKGALDRRDEGAVAWLSLRWVHRHGVEALPPLMQELTGGDASLKGWWHDHLHAAAVPAAAAGPTDSSTAAAAEPTVAPAQVAQGFSFAEITLEAEPQEVDEPSAELVLSFAEVAGLEPAVPCAESAGTEPFPTRDLNADVQAQISSPHSDGADSGIGSEGAASAESAAEPAEAADTPIEFLGEPLAFDPWIDAPAVSIPLAENPTEPPASPTEAPAHDAARELVGQDGSMEGVAPANETPPSVSTAAPVTDDPGAEALVAAAPVPGDQALDGLAQWPRSAPEFPADPVAAPPAAVVPPFIPARPAAAGVFSFGADSVASAPQPAWPPSGEVTAAVTAADPVAVAPTADLQAVVPAQADTPAVEPAGAEAPAALAASLPAESSPTEPEAPEPAKPPIWRRPLDRVKNLVRVCVEEVVSTFQTMDSERNAESASETVSARDRASANGNASPSTSSAARSPSPFSNTPQPRGSGQARGSAPASTSPTGQRPPLETERPAGPARRSATEIAPELTPQGRTPPLRERAAAAVAGRPAPAPSPPGLASLRSWLPDDASSEDTRSS